MKLKSGNILPAIVVAQFFCTSLWFAGNAILPGLVKSFGLETSSLGHLTSAVQFGFISGTFLFALLMIADRFSPSQVFFVSALAGTLTNMAAGFGFQTMTSLLLLRFLTGFFLAGIYPVGMKIASDHFENGLGKALGFLVGALVIGTAFPHLLRSLTTSLPWKTVLLLTSALCIAGGVLMRVLVPDGPYRKPGKSFYLKNIFSAFRNPSFRSAALGYFGHMWELYTFWAFVPVMLAGYQTLHPEARFDISFLSFLIIAFGSAACVAAGYISQQFGAARIAFIALLLSGCCCLLSPIAFYGAPPLFIGFLIFWGLAVIADSPLFSSLVAQNAPADIKGSALTFVTCIGFSITILSIELLNYLSKEIPVQFLFLFLAAGPLAGLVFMKKTKL